MLCFLRCFSSSSFRPKPTMPPNMNSMTVYKKASFKRTLQGSGQYPQSLWFPPQSPVIGGWTANTPKKERKNEMARFVYKSWAVCVCLYLSCLFWDVMNMWKFYLHWTCHFFPGNKCTFEGDEGLGGTTPYTPWNTQTQTNTHCALKIWPS